MQLGNVKFLDSLNYFPMALSALSKAFGLDDKFKKGYFPHLFNTWENQTYIGPMPSIKYYNPDIIKEDARNKFLKWYEEHKYDKFDFQKEFIDYWVSDVDILTEACLKFRE
ncbi:unnamed protein product [Brassicogethes aeneus]|uniref:DNA-directed DNA polymerase n=1 Tax=Brassicogethes aeneus TaxID=1431903 RepID=A0A9P0FCB8_BRAAE|nr:unnamed protein product [Brassicogethes aeneus]